jgi:hypothetical protein
MAHRAFKYGISAAFMLFDSWFAHDDTISRICDAGYEVICRLKRNNVKYSYQGKQYTLKQLWQQVAEKKTTWIDDQALKGTCLNVTLPKTGTVRILFVSDGRKNWQALLCTDIEQEPAKILEYYAIRWSIEIDHPDYIYKIDFCRTISYFTFFLSDRYEFVCRKQPYTHLMYQ